MKPMQNPMPKPMQTPVHEPGQQTDALSAKQAAQLLGVSLATLYSYVSRGLLASHLHTGQRAKRYEREEVLRLLARNNDHKRAGSAAESAIAWGVPVLESRITLVENGQLYYRGQAVNALAASHTLEQTALLLWDCVDENVFYTAAQWLATGDTPDNPDNPTRPTLAAWPGLPAASASASASLAPIARAMALLPTMAESVATSSLATHEKAACHMQLLASALLGTPPAGAALPFHRQLAAAWQLDDATANLLRAALVLCADHELNVSTFTVRCVASTGANLGMVLCAGLAALSGPKHGGESVRVGQFLGRGLACPATDRAGFCAKYLQNHDTREGFSATLPGFGHPLYPHGDPRAMVLMAMLAQQPALPQHPALLEFAKAGAAVCGQAINIDFALVALEIAAGLPIGAAQILFALGRAAGWLAHALEQVETGSLIRPRARYVGKFTLGKFAVGRFDGDTAPLA
jgi:citrate synthase